MHLAVNVEQNYSWREKIGDRETNLEILSFATLEQVSHGTYM